MTDLLTATLEPGAEDAEFTVVLRVTNASGTNVDVLNPDLGRPAPAMNWTESVAAYRTALLISFGYLSVTVTDSLGDPLEPQSLQPWATPVLKAPVTLSPGEHLDVDVPLRPFFPLRADETYTVTVTYGTPPARAVASATLPTGDDRRG